MGKLIYSAITSLDLFVADREQKFEFAVPDEAVHRAVNDIMRPIGTHLYGRKLYEVMAGWETMDFSAQPPVAQEFGKIWRAAEKIVFSKTRFAPASARTKIEPAFDPDAIRRLKAAAAGDLLIGGPTLAAAAFSAGLVDDIHLFLTPVTVGGGTPALPDLRLGLELLDERRFGNGAVHLHYRVLAG